MEGATKRQKSVIPGQARLCLGIRGSIYPWNPNTRRFVMLSQRQLKEKKPGQEEPGFFFFLS